MLGREGHAVAGTSTAPGDTQHSAPGLYHEVAAFDLVAKAPACLWHNCETLELQAAAVDEEYDATPGGASMAVQPGCLSGSVPTLADGSGPEGHANTLIEPVRCAGCLCEEMGLGKVRCCCSLMYL